MKKQMTENLKNTNKGITLIALVITIIVMLILVAVTINMAVNGGLFEYAGKAVSDTENAINTEQNLASGEINVEGLVYDSVEDYISNTPSDKNFVVVSEEITGQDGQFKYVKLQTGGIQITRYIGSSTEVTIPAKYDGYTVYSVGNIDAGTDSDKRYNIFGETNSTTNTTITKIAFEEGIKKICYAAFYKCTGLASELKLPSTLKAIGDNAFQRCGGFTGNLKIPEGVTTIGHSAFAWCNGFNGTLTLPSTLIEIEQAAFSNCSGFKGNLTIPEGMATIGNGAFQYCKGFTGNLTIPDGLTSVGIQAFESCIGFTGTLTLPSTIKEIGYKAFLNCSGLTGTITLPSTVTVGTDAFTGSGVTVTVEQ